jgi:hypothetical protein
MSARARAATMRVRTTSFCTARRRRAGEDQAPAASSPPLRRREGARCTVLLAGSVRPKLARRPGPDATRGRAMNPARGFHPLSGGFRTSDTERSFHAPKYRIRSDRPARRRVPIWVNLAGIFSDLRSVLYHSGRTLRPAKTRIRRFRRRYDCPCAVPWYAKEAYDQSLEKLAPNANGFSRPALIGLAIIPATPDVSYRA